ncbi:MAG: hypothetical protein CVV23_14510 [Ignavibacteriae bacterium HGW-Ignavibacteriae-2]|nr:MAG: hypothetical protein CVV23_14510 [Ignavibacteriae bacterium HGW-Ignavibacteriae-2]
MKTLNADQTKPIWQTWVNNSEKHPDRDAIIYWKAGEEPFRWTYKNLIETAVKFSAYLMEAGIKKNDVCAIIIRHNKYFYPLYMGIAAIGALPAVLAYPNPRLHPDKFRQGLAGMCERSGLDWILTEHDLDEIIRPFAEEQGGTVKELIFPLEWDLNNIDYNEANKSVQKLSSEISINDPVLLQHSSGTTGLQKPVVLSNKAVYEHMMYYGASLNVKDDDKMISWLPLYHDMGLIAAFHMPLILGLSSVQLDPFEWVVAPSILCEAASSEKATITWLPNFAYNFMADRITDEDLDGSSLKSLRLIINCSEPVRAESHHKFINKFQQYDLNPNALSACYAMAETTFAVSQTVPDKIPLEVVLDRNELSAGNVVMASDESTNRVCVSSGKLIEGCKVKIVDPDRKQVGENKVGEIAVISVSLFDGYRNYPEKTAEALDENGWYYTGDYGFMHNDELFVIGRKKDIIIEAGNNIYPEDVEDAVNKVNGVLPGRVIAFGEEDEELGTEHVSVVAETNESEENFRKLKMDIIRAGMSINVNIKTVYLVPSRWLIKSSAGKPSRKANRNRIINKEFEQVWS